MCLKSGLFVVKITLAYVLLCFPACSVCAYASSPKGEVVGKTKSFSMPWVDVSADYWNFGAVKKGLELRAAAIEPEEGVDRESVHDVFTRWIFPVEHTGHRGRSYVDITDQCKGLIDERFVLGQKKWQKLSERLAYFKGVDLLIEEVVAKLLRDRRVTFSKIEESRFLRAAKSLAWQESRWQHYFLKQGRIFVLISHNSYNALADWGITQIARSTFHKDKPLNENFFASKGYCNIASSLYYGFLEYLFVI